MSDAAPRAFSKTRLLLILGGSVAFLFLFIAALRITVFEMFRGVASSRATGLAAMGWDTSEMWSTIGHSVDRGIVSGDGWIARSASLRTHTSSFERSTQTLHEVVSKHHGYFEDLRTESRSGFGRALAAALAVPSDEFDATLSELRAIGRIESISQAGEDSAVKIGTAARHLTAARTNLSRLQKLQRERKGELRDAVALEKDIAQANEAVAEAEREHDSLLSTVAQAHIRVTLLEDYRAPLEVSMAGDALQIRNSLVEGVGAVFATVAFFLSIVFGYGVPTAFWVALLFWPVRALWRRYHRPPPAVAAV